MNANKLKTEEISRPWETQSPLVPVAFDRFALFRVDSRPEFPGLANRSHPTTLHAPLLRGVPYPQLERHTESRSQGHPSRMQLDLSFSRKCSEASFRANPRQPDRG